MIKPYLLTFHPRDGYVHVVVVAENISKDLSIEYVRRIGEECRAGNYCCVLIERDIPDNLHEVETYEIAKEWATALHGIKTAILSKHPEAVDGLNFAITVANNRGARCSVFTSRSAAEKWLLSSGSIA